MIYAVAGPEVYELLVTRSAWSDEQFEVWLSDALAALLLDERARQPISLVVS